VRVGSHSFNKMNGGGLRHSQQNNIYVRHVVGIRVCSFGMLKFTTGERFIGGQLVFVRKPVIRNIFRASESLGSFFIIWKVTLSSKTLSQVILILNLSKFNLLLLKSHWSMISLLFYWNSLFSYTFLPKLHAPFPIQCTAIPFHCSAPSAPWSSALTQHTSEDTHLPYCPYPLHIHQRDAILALAVQIWCTARAALLSVHLAQTISHIASPSPPSISICILHPYQGYPPISTIPKARYYIFRHISHIGIWIGPLPSTST